MKRNLGSRWQVVVATCVIALILAVHLIVAQMDRYSREENFPSTNYSRIEDGLFVGGILSEPPVGTRAVLNVCETKDPYRAEVHQWQPIPDLGPAPGIDWLRSQVEFIELQRKAGRPVFVHCRAGVNRSAMVVAAYLMWRDGISRDQALEVIQTHRPRAAPFAVYMGFLSDWEQSLK